MDQSFPWTSKNFEWAEAEMSSVADILQQKMDT